MKRYTRRLNASLVGAVLALGACGGSDGESEATTDGSVAVVSDAPFTMAPADEPLAPLPTDATSLSGFRAQVFALNLGLELDDAAGSCAGQALVEAFGSVEAIEAIADSPTGADAETVRTALLSCGATPIEETVEPLPSTAATPTSEPFGSLADAKAALTEVLRAAQVGDDAELKCLFDTLGEQLGDDELFRQITADESTAEELADVRAAAVTCGVDPSFTES